MHWRVTLIGHWSSVFSLKRVTEHPRALAGLSIKPFPRVWTWEAAKKLPESSLAASSTCAHSLTVHHCFPLCHSLALLLAFDDAASSDAHYLIHSLSCSVAAQYLKFTRFFLFFCFFWVESTRCQHESQLEHCEIYSIVLMHQYKVQCRRVWRSERIKLLRKFLSAYR